MPSRPRPGMGLLGPAAASQHRQKQMEMLLGPNLAQGDYSLLRGVEGLTEGYNEALTGYTAEGEEVPQIMRLLTLTDVAGGYGPAGGLGSGIKKFRGAAPNRAGVDLTRYAAPRGDSPKILRLAERIHKHPETADRIRQLARKGEAVGRDWYNTEFLRDAFIKELGPEEGAQAFKDYIWMVGATSTGSKVPPNIRNASWYYAQDPAELAKRSEGLLGGDIPVQEFHPPKGSGYGHKMQQNQAKNIANYLMGKWHPEVADPRLNPKPRGFAQSLLGHPTNIAADKHFMRLMANASDDPEFLHTSAEISGRLANKLEDMGLGKHLSKRQVGGKPAYNFNAKAAVKANPDMYPKIKDEISLWQDMPGDNEYRMFEQLANELAEEMDMTGPQLQAALWMGAAQETGVAEASQDTFENLFKKIVGERAVERELPEEEVLRQFIRRERPLSVAPAGGLLGTKEETPPRRGLLPRA